MPDGARVVKILARAAVHLRATPGRKGMVVHLQEGSNVLVAGDLHGNIANLKKILEIASLDEHPDRHLVLQEFVHGTGRYPNGGCTSHQLLDIVAALKCQYPRQLHLLLGNHELSEWTGRSIAKDGERLNDLFAAGVAAAYGPDADKVMSHYHELFEAMPLAVRTASRVFITHSVPDVIPRAPFDPSLFDRLVVPPDQRGRNTSLHLLVWSRDTSESTTLRFLKQVDCDCTVNGHIACPEGFAVANSRRLIVDCVSSPAACVWVPITGYCDILTLKNHLVMLPAD